MAFLTAKYKGRYGVACVVSAAFSYLAGAAVFSFRNPGGAVVLIHRVGMTIPATAVATAVGTLQFSWMLARSFTVPDSGGVAVTPTRKDSKGTASVSQLRVASGGPLTAGTRTLDAFPVHGQILAFKSGDRPLLSDRIKFEYDCPIVLRKDEGIILLSRLDCPSDVLPAVGVEWDEVDESFRAGEELQ